MVERAALLKALRDMGFAPEEGPVEIRGYKGIRTRADIRVATENPEYDIGFREVAGVFECIADWFGLQDMSQSQFIRTLTQRYAYHVAVSKLEEQGFNLVTEEKNADGQIHLVLRRTI